jgi:hypothetical protein
MIFRKNRLFILLTLVLLSMGLQDMRAQSIELNRFYGWQLAGKFKLYYGDLPLESAPNYGAKLSVGLSSTTHAEVSYMRSDSEAWYRPYNISEPVSDTFTYSSNYITLAGLQEVDMGKIRPFGTFGMGLVVWSPKENVVDGYVQMQLTLGAGLKYWFNDFVGIRLQGSMMMPMIFNGGGFGCGIGTGGGGCGGAVYTRITPFQGEFSGGIILRIPHR